MSRITVPTINRAVLEVIGRHNPHAVASLEQLQEGVAKYCNAYGLGLTIIDDDAAAQMNATFKETIQVRIAYVQVSIGRRLTDLLRSLIGHINNAQLLDAALCTRAALELAGAIVFYETRIAKLLADGISTKEQMERFNDLIARNAWRPI